MKRNKRIAAGLNFESRDHIQRGSFGAVPHQRVDHHVTDEVDSRGSDAFALQILIGIPACGEQDFAKRVRNNAIDFFRHRAVEAAQPGLDVCHRNEKLNCDDRGCHRGVHIADHDHQVRFLFNTDLLELHHDPSSLLGVCTRPHTQVHIGNRNTQVAEEDIRHCFVVMLARVDENALQV